MNKNDLPYWLALNEFQKFGPKSMARLRSHFPTMRAAFYAPASELKRAGITPKTASQFVHIREDIDPEQILKTTKRNGFSVITIEHKSYPVLLKQIYDPPAVLYIWGKLPPNETTCLGMVGSRKASPYGLRTAAGFSRTIAGAGVAVISGLAYGIDEAAHKGALEAGGVTVGVLAGGLLILTSRQRAVAERIVKGDGAVISEFPLKMSSMRHHFPIRNRVISGMSRATLVVEAAEKSGSLITARAAMEQNREVLAVPGPVDSDTSRGTNRLIRDGAHVAGSAEDVLNVLDTELAPLPKEAYKPDSEEEAALLDQLSNSPVHIDELVRTTQLDSAAVARTLSVMEIKGRTKQIGGMYYVLL